MDRAGSAAAVPAGVAKGFLRDNLEVVCFAVVVILFFKTFVAQQFTIPSPSMRNTLMIGDWGFLPLDHLRGRPFLVWWSFREGGDDDTNAKVPGNPVDVLGNFLDGARHFLAWTRWERTGTLPK